MIQMGCIYTTAVHRLVYGPVMPKLWSSDHRCRCGAQNSTEVESISTQSLLFLPKASNCSLNRGNKQMSNEAEHSIVNPAPQMRGSLTLTLSRILVGKLFPRKGK